MTTRRWRMLGVCLLNLLLWLICCGLPQANTIILHYLIDRIALCQRAVSDSLIIIWKIRRKIFSLILLFHLPNFCLGSSPLFITWYKRHNISLNRSQLWASWRENGTSTWIIHYSCLDWHPPHLFLAILTKLEILLLLITIFDEMGLVGPQSWS